MMSVRTLHLRWRWTFRSPPAALWPLVADTDRFNRDSGLPAVHGEGHTGLRRRLRFRRLGMAVEWEEAPFEWVRPERFGVERRYRRGPVRSLRVRVRLLPGKGGGTVLVYETWTAAASPWTWPLVVAGLAVQRRRFGRTLRAYDARALVAERPAVAGTVPDAEAFAAGGRERLHALAQSLAPHLADPALAGRLARLIETADPGELAHLRAYAIAPALECSREAALEACLEAARAGILDLRWDVRCPLCRGVKQSVPHLAAVGADFQCDACDINARADLERLVEVTFRPAASIRAVEEATYCVGGPGLTPHIALQQLLTPGERREVRVALARGEYAVRAARAPGFERLLVDGGGAASIGVRVQESGPMLETLTAATPVRLVLTNETAAEQLVIVERTGWDGLSTTAAEVIRLQRFRDLFAHEVLRPGEQVSVGALTVVFTDLRDSTRMYRTVGDAPAFGRVMDHFAVLREAVGAEGGTVVKTIGDAIMAVFPRPVCALRAMLGAQRALAWPAEGAAPLALKVGIHHGPCIAVTMNERLDYFGSTVNLAARLGHASDGTDLIVSAVVADDPEVKALTCKAEERLTCAPHAAELKGFEHDAPAMMRIRQQLPGESWPASS